MLPPGRAREATRPSPTGSEAIGKTMGMIDVAFFAAMVAGEAAGPDIGRWWRRVFHETPDIHAEGSSLELDIRALYHGCVADRGRVDERQMREIEQILDDQQIVCLDVEVSPFGTPLRIGDPVIIRNRILIRELGAA